nr:MAG TPA: hypothetical protein [Caudoviricetes sp.]
MKSREYYDRNLQCSVHVEYDICFFCGYRTRERRGYVKDPPKRKLPYFGNHLK